MNTLQFIIVDPSGKVHLKMMNKYITGIEKLAQEIIYRLINTEVINESLQYNINAEEELKLLFTNVLKVIEQAIKNEQERDLELPDSERLHSLQLVSIKTYETQAIVQINVISEAGKAKTFSLTL